MSSRIQQLRIRLAGKALGGASELMLPKVQTEMSGVLYNISARLEDGVLSQKEQSDTLEELISLRDDLNAVIDLLLQPCQ